MAARLAATAHRAGLDVHGVERVVRLFERVMQHRSSAIPDELDPDHLHPARTALILLDDAGVSTVEPLLAGIALDSRRPELTPGAATLAAWGAAGAAALLAELPAPDADEEERREALVVASDDARLVALAERLDHARHLHLHPRAEWSAFHRAAARVELPVAGRTNAMLERRWRRWSDAFARRHMSD
jgi:hypothetical protein